jgi:hypothetical protein
VSFQLLRLLIDARGQTRPNGEKSMAAHRRPKESRAYPPDRIVIDDSGSRRPLAVMRAPAGIEKRINPLIATERKPRIIEHIEGLVWIIKDCAQNEGLRQKANQIVQVADTEISRLCNLLGVNIPHIDPPDGCEPFGNLCIPERTDGIVRQFIASKEWLAGMAALVCDVEHKLANEIEVAAKVPPSRTAAVKARKMSRKVKSLLSRLDENGMNYDEAVRSGLSANVKAAHVMVSRARRDFPSVVRSKYPNVAPDIS